MKKIVILCLTILFFSMVYSKKTHATDLFWISNSGNWNDPIHWSYSSGGKACNKIPTQADNVIFDENSFTLRAQKVNIIGNAYCKNFICLSDIPFAEFHGSPTSVLRVNGSFQFSKFIENYFLGDIEFTSITGNETIFSASKWMKGNIIFNGPNTTWTLSDHLLLPLTNSIYFKAGKLFSADKFIQTNAFKITPNSSGSLDLGNSHVVQLSSAALQGSQTFKIKSSSANLLDYSKGNLPGVTSIDSIRLTVTPPKCNGDSNAIVEVDSVITTTPGNYTYLLTDGNSNFFGNPMTNVPAGTYILTVTNINNGDVLNQFVIVNDPPPIIIPSYTKTQPKCFGDCNGKVKANPLGGTPPYSYLWANGQTGQTDSLLCGGTVSVIVTDNQGCSKSFTTSLNQPTPLLSNITKTNITCNSICNGQASVAPSGGAGSYTILWTPGGSTNPQINLCPGTYKVQITDILGCVKRDSVIITQPPALTLNVTKTDASCNAVCDGSITVAASGGKSPYVYSWAAPLSSSATNITNLCAGTYTVFVTDSNNCQIQQSITVNQPNALNVTINATQITCFGLCNGSAVATTTGGTAPYTFSWNTGVLASSVTNLCIGTYTLFVTDAKNCTKQANVTITQPNALVANSTQTNVGCAGSCDGTTNLAPTGGTAPYTFLWTPGNQTTSGLTNLCVGSYAYTIRDFNNCTVSGSVTVSAPLPLTVSTNPTQPTCNGVCDGQATATAAGGNAPYTYSWSNGQLGSTITNLCPGIYTVFASDNKGCTASATVTITQPPLLTISLASTTSSCGICTGTASVTPVGGSSPYTYSWSNGQTSAIATGLCIGNHSVIVTDSKNCTVNTNVTIDPVVIIQITSSATNALCAGACDGSATANASGGQQPYTFLWFPSGATTQTVNGLCAGTDSVRVTDQNGCFSVSSITFNDPPVLNNLVNVTNSDCAGSCNGSAVSIPSGGTPPYTLSWGAAGQTTNAVSGLCAGPQTVTVTDNNGCIKLSNFTVLEPAPILANEVVVQSQCLLNNGSITLAASGGTGPYSYSWGAPLSSSSPSVSNLAAGSYTVTITDNVSCSKEFTITVNDAAGPTASSSITNATCPGSCDGAIATNPPVGIGPFTYLWTPGNSTGTSISNLCAGPYSVRITDANGCKTVLNDTVVEPAPILSNSTIVDAPCGGQCNGSITLAPTGGSGTYTFSWSTGATSSSISNLCVGTYIVKITDSNGCTKFDTLNIAEPAAILLTMNKTNVTCNGLCNGQITGVVSGGTLPYTYAWSNGPTLPSIALLCPATYSLNVTDANGCVVSASAIITEPALLDATPSSTPNSCNASCDGTVDVIVTGGTPPYTYLWSPGNSTTPAVANLCAGTYSVTVTDNNTCTVLKSVTITEPSLITVATSFTAPTCKGACNGTAIATPTGGTAPYTYSWSINALSSQSITNLCAGTYTVFVTDLNGCVTSQSVTITEPQQLVANASSVNPTCTATCNGTATAAPIGGSGVYTYSWSPGAQLTQSISAVCAGTITVFVTDSSGCSVSQSLILTDPPAITIVSGATPANCGACDGALAVFPSGGSGGPYTYSWTPTTPLQTGQIASNLCAGLYTVFVSDVNNCQKSFSLALSNNSGPDNDTAVITNATCNALCNGAVTVTVSGGTLPYTYSWLPSGPTGTPSNSNLCAGTYNLQTTDASGCIFVSQVLITEPTAIAANDSTINISCNGQSDGQIFLFPSGGTGNYNYSWNPPIGATSSSVSGLAVGTYNVTITDSNNCSVPFSFSISNPPAISIAQSHVDLTCNGVCNGSAAVVPTGGTAPYRYSWSSSPSDTLANVGNLCAGSYTVTVTDSRNCVNTATIIIQQPAAIVSNLTINQIKCFGQCNGNAVVHPSGGTAPYTFSWIGVSSSIDSVSSMCAGNYAVTITDNTGCFISVPVTITEPGLLNANINSVDISCFGKCDGSATSLTLGGTPPFTYLWSPGNVSTAGLSNLCAGTYVLTVNDSNNCSVTQTAIINEPTVIASNFVTTAPTCNQNNGSIVVIASGGTPGYSYQWSPVSSINDTLSNLAANLYTVTITDSKGCSVNSSVPLSTTAFSANKLSLNVSCFGRCDGIASVSPSGGTAPYTYLWTPGGLSTDSITNLCPGTYFPKITDAQGCVVFETIQIVEPTQVQAITTSTNATCGLCDGTASVSGAGGSGSYTYLWSVNQTSFSVNSLCAGTYSVRVTDNTGCFSVSNVNISNSTGPSSEIIVKTDVTCNGVCNGAATITPIGGLAPYTYFWLQTGATTNSVTGLCSGTYDFEIIDANGCKRVSSVTILEPSPFNSGYTFTNAACGVCDGSITLNPTGGTAPYVYSWNNGQTSATLNSLCAGVYSVAITDSNGCSNLVAIPLNNTNAPTISHTTNNATCFGNCDGGGFIASFGGTPPYSFQWNTGQNSDTVYGLCAGTYFITVNDANNCKSTSSLIINEPTPVVFSISNTTNASCGNCDGTASVLPNGGTLPYTIFWSSGDTGAFAANLCAGLYSVFMKDFSECKAALNINISNTTAPQVTANFTNETCNNLCDGTTNLTVTNGTPPYSYFWLQGGQTTASLTGLCAGTYDYSVTDSLGCTFSSSVTINAATIINYNSNIIQPNCGLSNGSITVNPSGGAGGYTYSWVPGGASTATISNLSAGIYTLHMTDAGQCTYTQQFTVNNSNGPGVSVSFTDAHCNSACDGTATAIVSGTNSPFTYSWTPGGQITSAVSGLCAGQHSVTVTDNAGCKTINTVNISEPPPILFSISNTVNASCGSCNGSATIIPSGGFLPNSVLWSNGDVGLFADSLCAGVYMVSVTDIAGCSQNKNVSISNSTGPLVSVAKTDETCAGSCNGTATISVLSGNGPYTYFWLHNGSTSTSLTGLCAGSYNYQVKDTNGCVTTGSVTISAAVTVSVSFTKTNPDCGQCNGTLALTVTGGQLPYTYAWSPANPANAIISNLCPGIYVATITDANGCAQIDTTTLANSTGPAITYTATNSTCASSCNGSITAVASGVNPGYTYSWTPGNQTTPALTNLCAGNYIVEATDNLGCKGFQQIAISEPSPIVLSLSQINNVLCFGDSTGSISVIPSGGTIPYSYLWSTGDTTATISNIPNGNLFVTISDANGCDTISPTLVINTPLQISATSTTTSAQCSNTPDGSIDLSPSGGVPPYSFLWDDVNASTTEDLNGVIPGIYHVSITDANGCNYLYSDTVNALIVVQASAGPDDTLCFTNSITLVGNGGTTYKWFKYPSLTLLDNTAAVVVSPVVGANDYLLVAYNGLCSDSDIVSIYVNALPDVDLGPDQTVIVGTPVQLIATGGANGATYSWSPILDLTDTASVSTIATPKVTTTYIVKVTNPNGCFSSDSITINVLPTIFVNNGITPNGDGKNDVWEIDGIEAYTNCEVEVYNRWGEKLFSSPGYTDKWDGKYKGKDLPVGTYYYVINLHDEANPENITGPITIMR